MSTVNLEYRCIDPKKNADSEDLDGKICWKIWVILHIGT